MVTMFNELKLIKKLKLGSIKLSKVILNSYGCYNKFKLSSVISMVRY